MNTGTLAGNTLEDSSLEPIEALSRASAGVSVTSRVGDVSAVDDNPLSGTSTGEPGLGPHNPHSHSNQHGQHHGISPHHSLHHSHSHGSDPHAGAFPQLTGSTSMLPFNESQLKISDTMAKMENDVATVNQDLAYFRHVIDFQNSKIEKLTSLLIDLLHNKNVASIVNQLQRLQTSDPFNMDDAHDSVDDSIPESVHDSVHDPVHDVARNLPSLSSPEMVAAGGSVGVSNVPGVSLDSNMDPQLHQVAQAAVQAQAKSESRRGKRSNKRPFSKVSGIAPKNASNNGNSINSVNGMDSSLDGLDGTTHISPTNGTNGSMGERISKQHPHLQHGLHLSQAQQPGHIHQHQFQRKITQQHQNQHQRLSHHTHNAQHQQQSQHTQHPHQSQHLQRSLSSPRQQGHRQQNLNHIQEHDLSQEQQDQQQQNQQDQSQEDNERSMSVEDMPGLEVVNINGMGGRKKPKVTIDFLHNPMTVKEIYDEFTLGFRGQPPLREMDERYGRHEWRGDSRSKESKRFQRRKKLCDAIERGMHKYGKSAEEIQAFIEEFRGDKSLTWVMNGNLPSDLLE